MNGRQASKANKERKRERERERERRARTHPPTHKHTPTHPHTHTHTHTQLFGPAEGMYLATQIAGLLALALTSWGNRERKQNARQIKQARKKKR